MARHYVCSEEAAAQMVEQVIQSFCSNPDLVLKDDFKQSLWGELHRKAEDFGEVSRREMA